MFQLSKRFGRRPSTRLFAPAAVVPRTHPDAAHPSTDKSATAAAAAAVMGSHGGIPSSSSSPQSSSSSSSFTPPSSAYNSTVISNALRPPYETEGGHVPIYSMVHGLVQKRHWIFRNPEWCDLCKEPVALWVNHLGRKDHSLMDMHYTAMVEFKRRWNPETVLQETFAAFGLGAEAYHKVFREYDREHRNELYAMLVTLEEGGMLSFGEPRHTYLYRMQGGLRGMDHQGALVLHEFILGPFMRLYPDGHIQDYSNLVDFITCSYNMETVYDLCGLYTLDKIALKANYRPSSPAAVGLGGIAASSSATSGYESEATLPGSKGEESAVAASRRTKQQEDLDEEAFSRKAVFVRQLLGQLRWLTQPGQQHPADFTFPAHLITLGEICLKSLIVEIIVARLCEYVVRVESVWRSFGYERKKLNVPQTAKKADDVVPEPVKYFYRPMSPAMDDLYTTDKGFLEAELSEALQKKQRKRNSPSEPSAPARRAEERKA